MVTAILINLLLLGSCKKDTGETFSPDVITHTEATIPQFTAGVNGHPLNQPAYLHKPVETQLSLLDQMHLSCYRIDVSTIADGRMENEGKFMELATAAAAHGVKLLPMLYAKGLDYALSVDTARQRGYAAGHAFASRYGQHFSYYEMGNEHDWDVLRSRSLYGADVTDYDTIKFRVLAAYFTGMSEGIKSADPSARTIIDGSTGHTGFYRLLKLYNVPFDVIGHHWYMTKGYTWSRYTSLMNAITAVFNNTKPVWITEANRWKGSYKNGEEEQKEYVTEFLAECRKNPNIEAVLLYELLDEPGLPLHPGFEEFERCFGLVKSTGNNTKVVYKPVAVALQKTNFHQPEE